MRVSWRWYVVGWLLLTAACNIQPQPTPPATPSLVVDALPDLSVSVRILVRHYSCERGQLLGYEIVIYNSGLTTAPAFTLQVDGIAYPMEPLLPGATLTFTEADLPGNVHFIEVAVDPENQILETDETNNTDTDSSATWIAPVLTCTPAP